MRNHFPSYLEQNFKNTLTALSSTARNYQRTKDSGYKPTNELIKKGSSNCGRKKRKIDDTDKENELELNIHSNQMNQQQSPFNHCQQPSQFTNFHQQSPFNHYHEQSQFNHYPQPQFINHPVNSVSANEYALTELVSTPKNTSAYDNLINKKSKHKKLDFS
jgi:hypothetical protein